METKKGFQQLVKDLNTLWKTPKSRIIGHIVYFLPISKGEKHNDFTMHWPYTRLTYQKLRIFREISLISDICGNRQ